MGMKYMGGKNGGVQPRYSKLKEESLLCELGRWSVCKAHATQVEALSLDPRTHVQPGTAECILKPNVWKGRKTQVK